MGVYEVKAFDEQRVAMERSLISLVADDPRSYEIAVDLVDADDFSGALERDVWRIICSLHARGRYTLRALEEQLGGMVGADKAPALIDAMLKDCTSFGVHGVARDVREMANKARVAEVVKWTEVHIADPELSDLDLQVIIEEGLVEAIKAQSSERKAGHFADGVDDWLSDLMSDTALARGVTTGVDALDAMVGGYRPGELIVVGGRPSMGKSIVATAAATACAMTGQGVFIASLEMRREEMRARVLCDLARDRRRIEYQKIMRGEISPAEAADLRLSADALKSLSIIVDDRGGLSAAQISLSARRAARSIEAQDKTLGLVVVDYLQLMAIDGQWRGDKNNGVGANSAAMKQLAKDLNCPVMLLSQLNRSVEARDDKRPTMSDLRDSGSIEQDADVVMFPFRPEYYLARKVEEAKDENERTNLRADLGAVKGKLSLIIEKQRNGPRGVVPADVDVATASIRDEGRLHGSQSSLLEGVA